MGKLLGHQREQNSLFSGSCELCGVAAFELDYSRDQKIPYDPIVVRMVRTLKAEGC
jgi:hypothetical protein